MRGAAGDDQHDYERNPNCRSGGETAAMSPAASVCAPPAAGVVAG
jgi:hypothetical protein